jgi:hypothetical protein
MLRSCETSYISKGKIYNSVFLCDYVLSDLIENFCVHIWRYCSHDPVEIILGGWMRSVRPKPIERWTSARFWLSSLTERRNIFKMFYPMLSSYFSGDLFLIIGSPSEEIIWFSETKWEPSRTKLRWLSAVSDSLWRTNILFSIPQDYFIGYISRNFLHEKRRFCHVSSRGSFLIFRYHSKDC